MMVVILLGPPGVGKGTQGVLLSENPGWSRLATGDLLREARRNGTELGRKAQGFMDAGELVPDSLILDLVEEAVTALPPGAKVIFDGFPRTLAQAEALDEVLAAIDRKVDRVVVLEAPEEILVKRISGRRTSPSGYVYNVHFDPPEVEGICDRTGETLIQREDDREETVRHRLEVYRAQTEPLVAHYERAASGMVVRIDGDRAPAQVQEEVRAAVREEG